MDSEGLLPRTCSHRSNKPVLDAWQQLEITVETAPGYFGAPALNIGVLLGDKFGSADVDCDCPEAIAAARELLPETGLVFGRQSKPFSHYMYRSDPPVRTEQFQDPLDHSTLIELRGLSSDGDVGLQTIVPPSTHVSGEIIRFEKGFEGTPANVDADVVISAVRKVAAVALLARHWPKQGSRHYAFLALAGVLVRAQWGLDEAKLFHRALYRCIWQADPDLGGAEAEVQSTFQKYSVGSEITGAPTLIEFVDKKVIDVAFRWLGIDPRQHRNYLRNDTGNADRLADWYGRELVYCSDRKGYYVWTGQRWQFDEFVEVEKRAEKATLEAFVEAKHITESAERKAFVKFVNNSLSRAH